MTFKREPANLMSTSRRGIVYGVGINDADYITTAKVNGRNVLCPLYNQWKAMIQRCYCPKWQRKYPTYIGCSVTPEWLSYSGFQKWAEAHDWEGKNLDKDLLVPGNKVYGPTTCLWVDGDINRLVLNSVKTRGDFPIGVSLMQGRFTARLSTYGKAGYLGLFDTADQAAEAFRKAKSAHVREVAQNQTDTRLVHALLRIADSIEAGTYYG